STNSYHLFGYFPGYYTESSIDETSNCFKLDNTPIVESNLPIEDVKWIGDETDIAFNFFSYDCGQNGSGDNLIVDYGNGVSDTISSSPYGSSGGVPNIQTVTPKKMYDSLCIAIRLKNYAQAKSKCYNLLNSYADSVQGLNAISKLYLLAVSFDTSAVSANECKTFLNTLILNHPNNLPLVRKCNYYIQKCKVRLKEYQSALTGFQQIIQQNPYTYEALLASWDYAATHLLDSLNGHSGGLPNVQFSMDNVQLEEQTLNELIIPEGSEGDAFINDYIEKLDKILFNDDDKDKFTKEERKTISSSIVTALDDSKKKAKNHIETLKSKSEKGDSYAKVELKVMKTINEVVRIKKPKTIFEHINSVNKDIQKLNTVKNEAVKKVTNIIPTTYSLSQNYPNPFNPVTKINYELPKDGKVKIVIYDILGRQIKTLVNNEIKQAGRYTVEFNGTQYASGVYFYRIQVEDGKGFTAVKKMVLIK
ncbi:MAG: T9SS type A sorting domain-containing protein, partial [Ignavibacteriae bacterium]|nr:T9SS type A sorting domain-containing protein [Ignavibacteriota bacterium]